MLRKIWMVGLAGLSCLLLTLTGCAQGPTQAAVAPEAVTEAFYSWYLAYEGNPMADKAYQESEYLDAAMVTKADEIIASFDKGAYDVFLCAQDIPTSIEVGEAEIASDTARLTVGTNFGTIIDVTLSRADGAWKISDIVCH
ncbi:MAG: hypothetical protein ACLFTI_01265 [Anaerolineales bacterium]